MTYIAPSLSDILTDHIAGIKTIESYLDLLLPGDADTCTNCTACNSEGACRDWVEGMAEDANVPAEWLAEMVVRGVINHTWGVREVDGAYNC
jgi:hypothetical protein